MTTQPVTLILATYEGERYLSDQLQSLLDQTHRKWHLILSDDGSTDRSRAIARDMIPVDRLTILEGPRAGAAQNFLFALRAVPQGHFAGFCDQDDVWRPDKLARAMAHLSSFGTPTFYTSGRSVTNAAGQITGHQARTTRPFSRLIWRGAAAGNTMMMNAQAVTMLTAVLPKTPVPFHDWWASLVLTGAGASWVHDPAPTIMYRQHGRNLIGASGGRGTLIAKGTYLAWIRQNLKALSHAHCVLTPKSNRQVALWSRLLLCSELRRKACPDKTSPRHQMDQTAHAQWIAKVGKGN